MSKTEEEKFPIIGQVIILAAVIIFSACVTPMLFRKTNTFTGVLTDTMINDEYFFYNYDILVTNNSEVRRFFNVAPYILEKELQTKFIPELQFNIGDKIEITYTYWGSDITIEHDVIIKSIKLVN